MGNGSRLIWDGDASTRIHVPQSTIKGSLRRGILRNASMMYKLHIECQYFANQSLSSRNNGQICTRGAQPVVGFILSWDWIQAHRQLDFCRRSQKVVSLLDQSKDGYSPRRITSSIPGCEADIWSLGVPVHTNLRWTAPNMFENVWLVDPTWGIYLEFISKSLFCYLPDISDGRVHGFAGFLGSMLQMDAKERISSDWGVAVS
jgi:hypothetical protein